MPSKSFPLRIISIDVGLRTLSISKEIYTSPPPSLPKKVPRYIPGGESTPEFKLFLDQVSKTGEVLFLEKIDLGERLDYFSGRSFDTLYDWLQQISDEIDFVNTDIILIEQQMKNNHIATAIMHHIHCWLRLHLRSSSSSSTVASPPIKLYPSKNKTRVLGMALKLPDERGKLVRVTKYQRKKWSIQQIRRWIELRQDEWSMDYIFTQNKSKADDICDSLLQSFSYVVGLCC